MDVLLFSIISAAIGFILLLFGLKLMKFAVSLMGFVLGYSIASSIIVGFGLPEGVAFLIALAAGIALAFIAFSFYKFAIAASSALFFTHLTFTLVSSLDQGVNESWLIAIVVGVLVFFLIVMLKLVDVFFAVATAAQGSNLIIVAVYSFIYPAQYVLSLGQPITEFSHSPIVWTVLWVLIGLAGLAYQLKNKPRQETV